MPTPFRYELPPQVVIANRHRVKQAVVDALAEGHRAIVVDCGSCGYIDSAGLGALLSARKKALESGATFTLVGVQDDFRTLLEVAHIDRLLLPAHEAVA